MNSQCIRDGFFTWLVVQNLPAGSKTWANQRVSLSLHRIGFVLLLLVSWPVRANWFRICDCGSARHKAKSHVRTSMWVITYLSG